MKKYARYIAAVGFLTAAMVLLYLSAVAWGSLALGKVMFRLESPVSVSEGLEVMRLNQEEIEKSREEANIKKNTEPRTGTEPGINAESGVNTEQGNSAESGINTGFGINTESGTAAEAEAPPTLCIWGQKEGVTLQNKNLSKSAQVNAILLCGEPELVFAGCQVPVQGDTQGCVISQEAAWELFGSSQVEGKEVSYGGFSYVIRQVLSIQGNVFAFQVGSLSKAEAGGQQSQDAGQPQAGAALSTEERLDRVTVKGQEGLSNRDLTFKLAMQYNLSVQMLDLELLRGISGCCMLLAPFTVCLFFCLSFYLQYKRQKTISGKVLMAGAVALCAALSLFLLGGQIQIPEDYIPSRWSDFSFWMGMWKEKMEAVRFLVGMDKAELDYGWVGSFFRAAGYGLLAEALLIAGIVSGQMAWIRSQGKKSSLKCIP